MKPKAGNRRGQAAAEYLVTYGWALLLLVAVIAIILSTGIFNPSYFISEECVLQPDLACTGHQLYRAGGTGDTTLLVRVENRLGYDIRLGKATIIAKDLGSAGEVRKELDLGKELGQGRNETFSFTFGGERQPPVDSIQRMRVELTYYSCAREVNPDCEEKSEYMHTVSGRITARVAG